MRVFWFVTILGVIATGLIIGCNQDPSTPAGNSSLISTSPSGGSIDFDESYAAAGSSRGNPLDNDIALSQTVFSTDFTTAGVGGLRGQTSGNITLAGVSGTVTMALLYWSGPTNSLDPLENSAVTVNGSAVIGANIGFSSDNCWGFDNSQAYMADVTAIVTATGNGVYALTDFGSVSGDNNGASLIVFFDDGDDTNNRDVVLFHGNDSNINNPYDADGWNVSLAGINYDSGTASLQLHVADGQVYPDDALTLNGDPTFEPGPQVFDGNTVPSDNNGPLDNGNLWDIRTFDVTTYLVPGPNTLTLTTGLAGDCLGLIVALIDLPAGAAPTDVIAVEFDAHPTSCPNPLNARSRGVFPAAILGTADFDVTTIDPSTLLLEGVAPLRWEYADVATPDPEDAEVCDCNEMAGDFILDLVLKFNTQELVAAIAPFEVGDIIEITITGLTTDGDEIEGTDCVIIRGHGANGL